MSFRVQTFHKDIPENAQIFQKTFGVYSNGTIEVTVYFDEPYQTRDGETYYAKRWIHYVPTPADMREYEMLKEMPLEERLKYNRSIRHWTCSAAEFKDGLVSAHTCDQCHRTFNSNEGHTCPADYKVPEELWVYWDFKSHPAAALRYRYVWLKRFFYYLDAVVSTLIPGRKRRWTSVRFRGNLFFVKYDSTRGQEQL